MSLLDKSRSFNKGLLSLLFITVALTLWTLLHNGKIKEEDTVELADREPSAHFKKQTVQNGIMQANQATISATQNGTIPLQKLKREPQSSKVYNLFKVHSWVVVPPTKKVKPAPPPPPVAPPAPFTYLGKLENSPKGTLIFLMANNKLYSVIKGEKIDQQWRLDAEETNTLRLTYIPLNLTQTLSKLARQVVAVPVTTAEMNQ